MSSSSTISKKTAHCANSGDQWHVSKNRQRFLEDWRRPVEGVYISSLGRATTTLSWLRGSVVEAVCPEAGARSEEHMRGVMSVQRKSFVFPQDVSERLERLTSTTRLESNSSVVRLALVVLEDLVGAIAKGEKIVIQDESGHTRAYNPFVAPGPLEKRRPGSSRDAA
jgi:hypothetical protein